MKFGGQTAPADLPLAAIRTSRTFALSERLPRRPGGYPSQDTQSRCEVGKDSIQGVADGMAVPIHRHKDLYTEYDGEDEDNPALPRNRTVDPALASKPDTLHREVLRREHSLVSNLGRTQDKDCTLLPRSPCPPAESLMPNQPARDSIA